MRLASRKLFYLGWISLVCGIAFYLVARPSGSTYFFGKLLHLGFSSRIIKLPALVQGSFPDFVHPFAFSLIGMGLLSLTRVSRLAICSSFLVMNLFFKVGQKYKYAFAGQVPPWIKGIPIMENTGSFFLRGTFDINDIFAMIVGAAAAFALSELLVRQQKGGETC